jgi:hypothetical protein
MPLISGAYWLEIPYITKSVPRHPVIPAVSLLLGHSPEF